MFDQMCSLRSSGSPKIPGESSLNGSHHDDWIESDMRRDHAQWLLLQGALESDINGLNDVAGQGNQHLAFCV